MVHTADGGVLERLLDELNAQLKQAVDALIVLTQFPDLPDAVRGALVDACSVMNGACEAAKRVTQQMADVATPEEPCP